MKQNLYRHITTIHDEKKTTEVEIKQEKMDFIELNSGDPIYFEGQFPLKQNFYFSEDINLSKLACFVKGLSDLKTLLYYEHIVCRKKIIIFLPIAMVLNGMLHPQNIYTSPHLAIVVQNFNTNLNSTNKRAAFEF